MSCCSISKNHVKILCIIGKFVLFRLHFHKVFRSYSANRADVNGGIKNSAADKTFYQCPCSFFLLWILFFLKKASEVKSVIKGILKLIFVWFKPYTESFCHLHIQLFQSFDQMRHGLSAPSIASECAGEFSTVCSRKYGSRKIPDRFQCFPDDCR